MNDNKPVTTNETGIREAKKRKAGVALFVIAAIFAVVMIAATVFSVITSVDLFTMDPDAESLGEAIGIAAGMIIIVVFVLIADIAAIVFSAACLFFSALAVARTKGALKVIDIVILALSALCLTCAAVMLILLIVK